MGKKKIFWILDNYMTNDSACSEVKKYIENLIEENKELKQRSNSQYVNSRPMIKEWKNEE